ncbi:nitrous oxide-stimulated promoter family protein [Peptacetobacter sp.]|uniref:nitrous oxide-stimulated promoter family protein n=1 Tax=Peptacetobacter sp. TaxID=2991975 RepID=UPI00261ECB9B|nr:nitrous oxide-stimulated promoter family protein [Peptacetobacter sp.]
MNEIKNKREKEKRIVEDMIYLYCRKKHKQNKNELCEECLELLNYAKERSEKCPFMETKTFCVNCKVHCYKKDMREKIKEVMKFSGPRMIFYHPIVAISHVVSVKKEKKKLK